MPKRTTAQRLERHYESVSRQMRAAATRGEFTGRLEGGGTAYLARCTRVDPVTSTNLLFTRDVNHHNSGWFKNPDYERCLHLSLSPIRDTNALVGPDGRPLRQAELDRSTTQAWVKAFFTTALSLIWAESPKSRFGIEAQVWHWRLFCDPHWQPILPRGEVYGSELTEAGWRSASQVFEEDGAEIVSTLNP